MVIGHIFSFSRKPIQQKHCTYYIYWFVSWHSKRFSSRLQIYTVCCWPFGKDMHRTHTHTQTIVSRDALMLKMTQSVPHIIYWTRSTVGTTMLTTTINILVSEMNEATYTEAVLDWTKCESIVNFSTFSKVVKHDGIIIMHIYVCCTMLLR